MTGTTGIYLTDDEIITVAAILTLWEATPNKKAGTMSIWPNTLHSVVEKFKAAAEKVLDNDR